MNFVLLCYDKPEALSLRMETRPAHLDYIAKARVGVELAGPLLSPTGEPMGSMFVLSAENEADVQAFADNDPYTRAGLFDRVEIRPYKIVTGALAPA